MNLITHFIPFDGMTGHARFDPFTSFSKSFLLAVHKFVGMMFVSDKRRPCQSRQNPSFDLIYVPNKLNKFRFVLMFRLHHIHKWIRNIFVAADVSESFAFAFEMRRAPIGTYCVGASLVSL